MKRQCYGRVIGCVAPGMVDAVVGAHLDGELWPWQIPIDEVPIELRIGNSELLIVVETRPWTILSIQRYDEAVWQENLLAFPSGL